MLLPLWIKLANGNYFGSLHQRSGVSCSQGKVNQIKLCLDYIVNL